MTGNPVLTLTALTPADLTLPLLVLGPSLGTSASTLWSGCVQELTATHQVVAWDLPGHGASTPSASPFTIDDLARAVLAAVEPTLAARGEHHDAPFNYAGDSVGGAVGLQLLLNHPARVAAATLICTGARIGEPTMWHERAAAVHASGTAAVVDTSSQRWFAPGFTEREPVITADLVRALREADATSYAHTCDALAAFDVRDRLSTITGPVCAVAGRHDVATPIDTVRQIAHGVPGARFVVLEGVAHLAPAESPTAVAALIAGMTPSHADPYAAGMTVRRAVLGDAHVDRSVANTTDLTRDFQDFITRYAWGSIWTRPGLDRRSRSMITLTALVARGHHEELAMHVRAAVTNGLTRAEIIEVLLQSAIYCGVPDANTAFRIAQRVLDDLEPPATDDKDSDTP